MYHVLRGRVLTSESAISSTWKESTWGKEVSINYGKSLRDYDTNTGDFQVFGTNGPIGWCDHFLVDGPGIILGRKGATRGVFFSERPFYVIDTAYYVTPNSKMNLRWLYFAINYHRLAKIDDGSPIPSTPRSAIRNIPLLVPPVETQEKIGNCLTNYDHLSLSNQNIANITQKIISTLFRSWFIDFEPVKAKSEGKLPYGMDEETAALFPDSFEDSELGPIPTGWRASPISEICKMSSGGTPSRSKEEYFSTQGVGYPWLASRELNGNIIHDAEEYISELGLKNSSAKLFPENSVAMAMYGATAGRIGFFAKPLTTSQAICVMLAKENICLPKYLYFLIGSESWKIVWMNALGGAQPNISQQSIGKHRIVLPRFEIIQKFESLVEELFSIIDTSSIQSEKLAGIRDALIPRLISGELKVN